MYVSHIRIMDRVHYDVEAQLVRHYTIRNLSSFLMEKMCLKIQIIWENKSKFFWIIFNEMCVLILLH